MLQDLFTIGNTPELRTIPSGKAVLGLSLAMDVGYGDNKRTTWISSALWEARATALAPHLVKGQQVVCVLSDIELDEYQKQDGTSGAKIKARIVDIKLVRGEKKTHAAPQQDQSQPQSSGFDIDDESIPF